MSSPDGESNLPLPFLLRSTHVGLAALSLVCSPGVVCWSGRNIVCALTSPSEFLARAIASVNSASHTATASETSVSPVVSSSSTRRSGSLWHPKQNQIDLIAWRPRRGRASLQGRVLWRATTWHESKLSRSRTSGSDAEYPPTGGWMPARARSFVHTHSPSPSYSLAYG